MGRLPCRSHVEVHDRAYQAPATGVRLATMRRSAPEGLAAWSLAYPAHAPKYVHLLTRSGQLEKVADIMIGHTDPSTLTKQRTAPAAPERVLDTSAIQVSKAWDAAMAPAKSIPMNLLMMYMSGNGVQIFSMMVVYMTVVNPLKAMTTVTMVFAPYRNPKHSLAPQMALFLVCQLACAAVGVYKCWSLGLLPTESSDWLAWYHAPHPLETSATLA